MPANNDTLPPSILLEEHFLSSKVDRTLASPMLSSLGPGVAKELCDLGRARIKDMDKNGVKMQLVSHLCGFASNAALCRAINDELATAVGAAQTRLAGLATLPMAAPAEAAIELERCIRELGFKGALIDNHSDGQYYTGHEYNVFWEAVESLDSPVYLHPAPPTKSMAMNYSGPYAEGAVRAMSGPSFGWHTDTATHVTRLFAAGVFDRFPKLKLILGHFGESLPFWKDRISQSVATGAWGTFARSFEDVYAENLWFTTSGCESLTPFICMLQNTKIERMMFSVDYPMVSMERGVAWLKRLKEADLLSDKEFDMLCFENAGALFAMSARG
ncbi:Decarboxylase orsB [Colletotrichum sidae]|uniref:Decarboxylase orsB n=1 Tax=Colletotrichum sidae TaxID=1347389 RepID=A0A4R8TEI0_9PEZI|nr:Decarboxylase orsB [Colletotrichum sidae]